MNARHFMIYYDHRTRELTKTTPKTWAEANQYHFPNYTFVNGDNPTVQQIENYLAAHYGFTLTKNDEFVLVYNMALHIPNYQGQCFMV
jgi:hypothetical protein